MQTKKKLWTKPVLIVIDRGTPEESVLKQCKTGQGNVPGPGGGSCKLDSSPDCFSNANS